MEVRVIENKGKFYGGQFGPVNKRPDNSIISEGYIEMTPVVLYLNRPYFGP